MKLWKYISGCLILCSFIIKSVSQDSIRERKIKLSGYIKDLQSFSFDNNFRNMVSGNLIHNRINIKWKPSSTVNGAVEFRNRVFWGEEVAATPGFADQLRNQSEWTDLSVTWANRRNYVLHSNIERLWVEWHKQQWNVRVGRQRINWGISTMWNPNDIFNAYNFLDVDYEERPGSDAVKAAYHFDAMTGIEMAVAASGEKHKGVGAMRLFTNKWNYDFQFIAGWYKSNFTVGGGWAGSIKDAGLKGEFMYFAPQKDTMGQLNLAMEWDYVFKKGWYINIGGLLNTNGLNEPVSGWTKLDFQLSPRNILPVRWAGVITASKEITPLFTANMSVLYSPKLNLLIILPGLKYNLATNLDIDLIWQSFFAAIDNNFEGIAHKGYLRLKWSF